MATFQSLIKCHCSQSWLTKQDSGNCFGFGFPRHRPRDCKCGTQRSNIVYSKVALYCYKRPLMALLILPFPLLTTFSHFSNFPFQFSLHLLPFPVITAKK